MLYVQVCSSNVLVLEGRGIGKGRGKREIGSEAFAEMEKKLPIAPARNRTASANVADAQ